MKLALFTSKNSATTICSDMTLFDLDYADTVMLLSKHSSKLQILLGLLNNSVGCFETGLAQSQNLFFQGATG